MELNSYKSLHILQSEITKILYKNMLKIMTCDCKIRDTVRLITSMTCHINMSVMVI